MLLSTERLSGSKRSAHGSLEYDTFPVLKSGIGSGDRNKDKTKTRRHIFQNDFPMPCTVREIDENRPETPIVKTRHERHLLALNGKAGNGRPILPRDTKDVYSSNGMYKRKLAATPCNNILSGKNGNRCPTPVPFQQPLTRLCWDNAGNIVTRLERYSVAFDRFLMRMSIYFKENKRPLDVAAFRTTRVRFCLFFVC